MFTALDAFVLLEIYDYLCAVACDIHLDIDLEPEMSVSWLTMTKGEQRQAKAARKAAKVWNRFSGCFEQSPVNTS